MRNKVEIVLIFFSILCCILDISAQDTVSYTNNAHIHNIAKDDTSLNNIIYYHNSKTDYLIHSIFDVKYDIFLTHYYNKANITNDNYYLKLNNEGSAVKDMIFHIDDIFNYRRTENIYSPYIFNKDNVKYFQNKKAYTSLSYSNALNGNQFFNVNFAKNLYKGLNLQTEFFVNYADGEFSNSQVMNQFFNVTLNYISNSGRYRNNLAFIHSRAHVQDNGGILNDSIFINHEYSKPGSFPVSLSQGWNKWKTFDYIFSQTYRLEKKGSKDSKILNKGAIVHNISFSRYARLYDDEKKTIKDSLGTNIFRNSVFWTNDIFSKYANFFIPLSIGVNYDVLNFNDSLYSSTFHLISPEITIGLKTQNFTIDAVATKILTSDDYEGDYQFDIMPKYYVFTKSNMYVFADIKVQNKQPDYIFKHYLTENLSWNNKVKKIQTNSISLGMNFANRFVVKLSCIDLKNFYFMDALYNMGNGDSRLYQVQIQNDFLWKSFRFKGAWSIQKAENEDVLHVPLIAIKQGMAYSFTWMRGKLHSQLGIDASYFSLYKADIYNTQLGMYLLQSKERIGNYVFADAYLNINIDRFTLFVMLQHPYAGLINYRYFSSPLYPAEGFTFRYGFTWKLLD